VFVGHSLAGVQDRVEAAQGAAMVFFIVVIVILAPVFAGAYSAGASVDMDTSAASRACFRRAVQKIYQL
jgi:hypothetical protein